MSENSSENFNEKFHRCHQRKFRPRKVTGLPTWTVHILLYNSIKKVDGPKYIYEYFYLIKTTLELNRKK